MSSALKRTGAGWQLYQLPLLLIVLFSLILPLQLCASEGVPIEKYRQDYHRRKSVYYDQPCGIDDIFNEPLYNKANASVEVHPPKSVAVIGIVSSRYCLFEVTMWLC